MSFLFFVIIDNITKYEYNKLGNVTKMVLGLTSVDETVNPEIHQVTNYEYNALNQLIKETNPENITTNYTTVKYNYIIYKNIKKHYKIKKQIYSNRLLHFVIHNTQNKHIKSNFTNFINNIKNFIFFAYLFIQNLYFV